MVKSNRSRTYLLPLIAPLIGIEKQFYTLIENTYLYDFDNEFENCFYIVQNFSFKNPDFTAYENRMTNNQYFIKCIDIADKVIYIFHFPDEYLPEYCYYKDGKFSKFGDDAKKQILEFWTDIKGKDSGGTGFVLQVKQILYKEKILREKLEKDLKVKIEEDAELGSIPDYYEETINLNNFENKIKKT